MRNSILVAAVLLGGCVFYGDDEPALDAGHEADAEESADAAPPAWGSHWTVTGARTGTCEAGPLELAATVDIYSVNPDSIDLRIGDAAPVTCLATFTDDMWRLNCMGTSLAIDPVTATGSMMIPYAECSLSPATYDVAVLVE